MTSADRPGGSSGAMTTPVSLYVHVPFCVSKCAYCDFYSEAGRAALFEPYVDSALADVRRWQTLGLLEDVPTLYFGGGTPTALRGGLVRLLEGILEIARLRSDAEITVETNPETTDPGLIARLVDAGVNRFSLGVQSFDDSVLRTLGRCHDAARALDACATLCGSGVAFSVDLICGVPGQTMTSWGETLELASSVGALHASVYPLTIEPGTPIAAEVAAGRVAEPDPDVAADMMLLARDSMAYHAMDRYEVANYAYPGYESRHNTAYWTGGAYLGVGPHAASMLPAEGFAGAARAQGWSTGEDEGAARVRFVRETTVAAYIEAPLASPGQVETLTAPEAAREDVMLGMRLTRGVETVRVDAAGVAGVLRDLEAEDLVERRLGADGVERWRTTERGWLLGNRVFGAIWSGAL